MTAPLPWGHAGCHVLLALLCLGALTACTTLPGPSARSEVARTGPVRAEASPRWWYARFRLHYGDDDEIDSYLDGLIADRLLSDIIARHQAGIVLWRFHRRWSRDTTGHEFSFIFFAPPALAGGLLTQIERHPLLASLRDDGHLREYRVDEAELPHATDPAGTSDPAWPPAIRREWPKFIMGASRMWLGLVQGEAVRHSALALHARYQAVEDRLDELWFTKGNHAFLHHLSALFGYRPVRVIRRDIMTF